MLRILCPGCSKEKPLVVEIGELDGATVCPSCGRRFRIRTVRVQEITGRRRGAGYLYRILGQETEGTSGLEKIRSAGALAIKPGRTVTIVRRGSQAVGVADQSAGTWLPVTPPRPEYPALRGLALALAWPVTVLAAIQALSFWRESALLLQDRPLAALTLFLVLGAAALLPLLWWLLRTAFPDGPRRKQLIRGWRAPGLDD